MTKFKKGDQVAILNCTLGGRFFVECEAAKVLGPGSMDETYMVEINGVEVERFVDPTAQSDPYGVAAQLTKNIA